MKHFAMMTWESGVITPHTLNFCTRCTLVATALYSGHLFLGEYPQVPIPQKAGHCEEQKNVLPLPRPNPSSLVVEPTAQSLC